MTWSQVPQVDAAIAVRCVPGRLFASSDAALRRRRLDLSSLSPEQVSEQFVALHMFRSAPDLLTPEATRAVASGWLNDRGWPVYHKAVVLNKFGPLTLRPPITPELIQSEPN